MEELGKYLAVYLAGATGIYKGIPVGIAFGLSPFLSASFTALGSISSVVILYLAGAPFRQWLMKKYGSKSIDGKQQKFTNWLDKYGVPGLGLMVTGLLGPFISLIMGMTLLKETGKFLFYLILGIILWSFAIAYVADPLVDLIKSFF